MISEQHVFGHPYFLTAIHWIVSAIALKITSALIKNFDVGNFFVALLAAFLIGAANYFIRPMLIFLTFPFTIITLGLFILVVDGAILRLCAVVLPGFEIRS